MPHTKSAAKRMRQSEKRRKRNRLVAKAIKVKRRAVVEGLKAGDKAKTGEAAKAAQQTLDRAASKGYIHPNKAARLKSRMALKLKAAAASKPSA
jgi:small subunit ribosomal protein S20